MDLHNSCWNRAQVPQRSSASVKPAIPVRRLMREQETTLAVRYRGIIPHIRTCFRAKTIHENFRVRHGFPLVQQSAAECRAFNERQLMVGFTRGPTFEKSRGKIGGSCGTSGISERRFTMDNEISIFI